MAFRAHIILVLLLSLLFTTQAPIATAQPTGAKMPGCAMTTCISGCCSQMACCARSRQDPRHEEQTPAPHRINLEFVALGQQDFSVLYALPSAARRLVPREEAQGTHTLPRLAATCIQLI